MVFLLEYPVSLVHRVGSNIILDSWVGRESRELGYYPILRAISALAHQA